MCKQNGGAMKYTSNKDWIHILCATWIPELKYHEKVKLVDMSKLLNKRNSLVCSICKEKGGCIQCSKGQCTIAYHATCAQFAGLFMGVQEVKKKDTMVTYCKTHTMVKKTDDIEKVVKSGAGKVKLGRFIDMPFHTSKEIKEKISNDPNVYLPEEALMLVCEYWKNKRYEKDEGKSPLIRRLLIETDDEKKKQEIERDKNFKKFGAISGLTPKEKYEELRNVRNDLEIARTIVDIIRKREKLKRQIIENLLKRIEVASRPPLILKLKLPKGFFVENPEYLVVPPLPPTPPKPLKVEKRSMSDVSPTKKLLSSDTTFSTTTTTTTSSPRNLKMKLSRSATAPVNGVKGVDDGDYLPSGKSSPKKSKKRKIDEISSPEVSRNKRPRRTSKPTSALSTNSFNVDDDDDDDDICDKDSSPPVGVNRSNLPTPVLSKNSSMTSDPDLIMEDFEPTLVVPKKHEMITTIPITPTSNKNTNVDNTNENNDHNNAGDCMVIDCKDLGTPSATSDSNASPSSHTSSPSSPTTNNHHHHHHSSPINVDKEGIPPLVLSTKIDTIS
eukprot:TRINITY_DN709_c7_g1_i1.p1 TRINITY_DN709_c7_g1~~TRINITY_DN709_c7_g1_i1.p1  ORF type:complete len:555 (+),score=157.90 TRINITY_DN709_c7_g1_i1:365-2029(+)